MHHFLRLQKLENTHCPEMQQVLVDVLQLFLGHEACKHLDVRPCVTSTLHPFFWLPAHLMILRHRIATPWAELY